jgi:hypothetical protein
MLLALGASTLEVGAQAPASASDATVAAGDAAAAPLSAKVIDVDGKVQWRPGPEAAWQPANVNDEIPAGSEVRTGLRSHAALRIGANATALIDAGTVFQLPTVVREGDVLRTTVAVKSGRADFKVDKVGLTNDFKVVTPSTTLAVRGTEFAVATGPLKQVEVVGARRNAINAIELKYALTNTTVQMSGASSSSSSVQQPAHAAMVSTAAPIVAAAAPPATSAAETVAQAAVGPSPAAAGSPAQSQQSNQATVKAANTVTSSTNADTSGNSVVAAINRALVIKADELTGTAASTATGARDQVSAAIGALLADLGGEQGELAHRDAIAALQSLAAERRDAARAALAAIADARGAGPGEGIELSATTIAGQFAEFDARRDSLDGAVAGIESGALPAQDGEDDDDARRRQRDAVDGATDVLGALRAMEGALGEVRLSLALVALESALAEARSAEDVIAAARLTISGLSARVDEIAASRSAPELASLAAAARDQLAAIVSDLEFARSAHSDIAGQRLAATTEADRARFDGLSALAANLVAARTQLLAQWVELNSGLSDRAALLEDAIGDADGAIAGLGGVFASRLADAASGTDAVVAAAEAAASRVDDAVGDGPSSARNDERTAFDDATRLRDRARAWRDSYLEPSVPGGASLASELAAAVAEFDNLAAAADADLGTIIDALRSGGIQSGFIEAGSPGIGSEPGTGEPSAGEGGSGAVDPAIVAARLDSLHSLLTATAAGPEGVDGLRELVRRTEALFEGGTIPDFAALPGLLSRATEAIDKILASRDAASAAADAAEESGADASALARLLEVSEELRARYGAEFALVHGSVAEAVEAGSRAAGAEAPSALGLARTALGRANVLLSTVLSGAEARIAAVADEIEGIRAEMGRAVADAAGADVDGARLARYHEVNLAGVRAFRGLTVDAGSAVASKIAAADADVRSALSELSSAGAAAARYSAALTGARREMLLAEGFRDAALAFRNEAVEAGDGALASLDASDVPSAVELAASSSEWAAFTAGAAASVDLHAGNVRSIAAGAAIDAGTLTQAGLAPEGLASGAVSADAVLGARAAGVEAAAADVAAEVDRLRTAAAFYDGVVATLAGRVAPGDVAEAAGNRAASAAALAAAGELASQSARNLSVLSAQAASLAASASTNAGRMLGRSMVSFVVRANAAQADAGRYASEANAAAAAAEAAVASVINGQTGIVVAGGPAAAPAVPGSVSR